MSPNPNLGVDRNGNEKAAWGINFTSHEKETIFGSKTGGIYIAAWANGVFELGSTGLRVATFVACRLAQGQEVAVECL